MNREIVMDTETTGVNPNNGDRIVEIGCLELINQTPTGKVFQKYINPQCPMPDGAFKVHGLSTEFLSDKPLFADIVDEFLEFIQDSKLVIHNAAFDIGFLNAELQRLNKIPLPQDRAIDTLLMARRKHPGAQNSLDALCSRYGIDSSKRTKHGALLDSEILAEVYIELTGGKQKGLNFAPQNTRSKIARGNGNAHEPGLERTYHYKPLLTENEYKAHEELVAQLGEKAIWRDYIREK